jgi:hypothetical protein
MENIKGFVGYIGIFLKINFQKLAPGKFAFRKMGFLINGKKEGHKVIVKYYTL